MYNGLILKRKSLKRDFPDYPEGYVDLHSTNLKGDDSCACHPASVNAVLRCDTCHLIVTRSTWPFVYWEARKTHPLPVPLNLSPGWHTEILEDSKMKHRVILLEHSLEVCYLWFVPGIPMYPHGLQGDFSTRAGRYRQKWYRQLVPVFHPGRWWGRTCDPEVMAQGKASGSFQRVMTRQIKSVCPVALLWLVGTLMHHETQWNPENRQLRGLEESVQVIMSACPPNIPQQMWTWQQQCSRFFWVWLCLIDFTDWFSCLMLFNTQYSLIQWQDPLEQLDGEDQEDSLSTARVDPLWLPQKCKVRPSRHQVCAGKRVRWPEPNPIGWTFAFTGWW